MRLMLAEQLFTFVTATPVEMPNGQAESVAGTNNEAERSLRDAAQARKTGRTNKTVKGARRQAVLVSVLESLRQQLPTFTFASVVNEVLRCPEVGSCFMKLTDKLNILPSATSILDSLVPLTPASK